jgi:AAA+ ATPase superfamily predicted ATPase
VTFVRFESDFICNEVKNLTVNHIYSRNPFSLEPVKVRSQFFGRRKETRRVLNFLHWGQSVSIVGAAGIGKTSFLNHVAHWYVRAKQGLAEEKIFVRLDGISLVDLDQIQCFRYIREEIIRQVKNTTSVDKAVGVRLEKTVREAGSKTVHFGLQTLFRIAQADGLKLVIILDHLDTLNQNRSLEAEFFSALRSLHTNYELAYLVASRSPLDKLERICPEGPGSPFFNIFQQIAVDSFTSEESRQLVITLLELTGAQFPEPAIDFILELGCNTPYRLQRAGYIAFQVWQENGGHFQEGYCEEIRRRFEEMET